MIRTAIIALGCWMTLAVQVGSAAKVRSDNFIVDAPTEELAQEFAKLAEKYRAEKAKEWFGAEMPKWDQPCPLKVIPQVGGSSGATTFDFPRPGQVVVRDMWIKGPLDRLRVSVLPHEVTHTIFANHFRRPVPRWADEGGSVYSEDDRERNNHDRMCRDILNAGKGFPLRRLFALTEYPQDYMTLYAEGYSISRYLIESKDRTTFLNFVGTGLQSGWDAAAKIYGHKSVEDLEEAWLAHLRKNGGRSAVAKDDIAKEKSDDRFSVTASEQKLVVRQSAPPTAPTLPPPPAARGYAPSEERDRPVSWNRESNPWQNSPRSPAASLGVPARLGAPVDTPPVEPQGPETRRSRPSGPPVLIFPPQPLPER